MAKVGFWLKGARGKLAGSVLSPSPAGTIIRENVTPSNPRTFPQNVQRAIFATAAKAAAAMNPIVDHSFAGIKYGSESVRYFRKENLAIIRNAYLRGESDYSALTPKGGSFMPNNYLISTGNLPGFEVINDSDGSNICFRMGVSVDDDEDVIGWDQFKKIYPYVQPGDQLTIAKIVIVSGSLKDGNALFTLQYDRIILSPDENLLNSLDYVVNTEGFNPAACDLTVTTNTAALKSTEQGNGWYIGLGNGNQVEQGIYACALILSREVNGNWQRSRQYMNVINFDDVQDNEAAIATYDGTTQSLSSDTEYLDQADSTTVNPGISGAYIQVQYGQTIRNITPGETLNLGEITLADDLQINVTAYGVEGNHVTALTLTGNNVDGEYSQRGSGRGYNKALTFTPADDGNLAGTYKIECLHWAGGLSTVNFTLAPGE